MLSAIPEYYSTIFHECLLVSAIRFGAFSLRSTRLLGMLNMLSAIRALSEDEIRTGLLGMLNIIII